MRKLLIVANRGPFQYEDDGSNGYQLCEGEGGVATALRNMAESASSTFLCSPMTLGDRLVATSGAPAPDDLNSRLGCDQRFVPLDAETYARFYEDFSNETLWFLQHGLPWPDGLTTSGRLSAWRSGYLPANQAFSEATISLLDEGEFDAVVFHDYHLYLAPLFVRNLRPKAFLQQIVHIPWPEPDAWAQLHPEIFTSICEGLLANDSVVFQTPRFAQNFLQTCREFLPEVRIDRGLVSHRGHVTRVWSNPISSDPIEIGRLCATPAFSSSVKQFLPPAGQQLIVRVDRLDPSKNILRGFEAYDLLLNSRPELCGKVSFLAFLVPSRTTIPVYQMYARSVLELAHAINQKYGTSSWQPIRLVVEHNRPQALAGLAVADVVLANSVADGMNLVAKESALVGQRDAVLVLSRTAGAYEELGSSCLGIEPEDVPATADALYRALTMTAADRQRRHQLAKHAVVRHDLAHWQQALLTDIGQGPLLSADSEPSPSSIIKDVRGRTGSLVRHDHVEAAP